MKKLYGGIVLSCLLACGTPMNPAHHENHENHENHEKAAAETQNMRIAFAAQVNGAAFECGREYDSVGRSKSRIQPRDFRMYISRVHLLNAGGHEVPLQLENDGKWQFDNVALLDFEDKTGACESGTAETRFEIVGQLPQGDYRGLRFELGVPFELNHQDATVASSPLNLSSMFWSWRGGYKFLRADFSSEGMPQGYFVHVGSTGCTDGKADHNNASGHGHHAHGKHAQEASQVTEACEYPNRAAVSLNNFEPGVHRVVADLGHLLAQSDVDSHAQDTAQGCMSSPDDPDCRAIFDALAIQNEESLEQSFFRLETLN